MSLRATHDANEIGRWVDALVQTWRAKLGPVRPDSAAAQLIPKLPIAPILTVATAAQLIGRSDIATNKVIAHLVEAGILNPTTVGRGNRVYEAVGLLDLFTDIERALASGTGDSRDAPPARPVPAWPR